MIYTLYPKIAFSSNVACDAVKEMTKGEESESNDLNKDDNRSLKERRVAKGMSQKELSEASGVDVRMIQHYEQGTKSINGARAINVYWIAQALGCTVEDLLDFDDDNPKVMKNELKKVKES